MSFARAFLESRRKLYEAEDLYAAQAEKVWSAWWAKQEREAKELEAYVECPEKFEHRLVQYP